jgi:hypothetical protein
MHRSLPSSARCRRVLPRTAAKLPLLLPQFPGQGSNLRQEDLHGMQRKFRWCDSLLSCPTLVGHIHLNKHLDSTSPLGRLLVKCDLFFYCIFEWMFLVLVILCECVVLFLSQRYEQYFYSWINFLSARIFNCLLIKLWNTFLKRKWIEKGISLINFSLFL